MQQLANEVRAEIDQLGRELSEIELLLQQTRTEAERHEGRRRQAAERLPALERSQATSPDSLAQARAQLVTLSRRAALMEGQVQVLEGKQKVLRRFHDFLAELMPHVESALAAQASNEGAEPPPSRSVLAAQEDLRRDIARQMHDGPAQSIANVALQAHVIQRLMEADPRRAQMEMDRLGEMVQHALEATKTFIFEVRPMVLDDLGLVATLRRAALEKARHTGVPVRFESVGADRRLDPELESGLFRIVQNTVDGFVGSGPAEVVVRLDWTDGEVRATVRSRTAEGGGVAEQHVEQPAASASDRELPPALATILQEQQEYEANRAAEREQARALPQEVWNEVSGRASAMGISVVLKDNGRALEAAVSGHSQD